MVSPRPIFEIVPGLSPAVLPSLVLLSAHKQQFPKLVVADIYECHLEIVLSSLLYQPYSNNTIKNYSNPQMDCC